MEVDLLLFEGTVEDGLTGDCATGELHDVHVVGDGDAGEGDLGFEFFRGGLRKGIGEFAEEFVLDRLATRGLEFGAREAECSSEACLREVLYFIAW